MCEFRLTFIYIKEKDNVFLRDKILPNMFNLKLGENVYTKNIISKEVFDKEILENRVLNNVDNMLGEPVKLIDNLSKDEQLFYIKHDISGQYTLLNQLGQKIGKARPWEDDEIPDKHKIEGIVVDPEDGFSELMEFIVEDKELVSIPNKIYREYTYVNDLDILQPSFEVESIF